MTPPGAPGGPGGIRRPAPFGNDQRLRELEDKMNRLLKELEDLKGDKKQDTKGPGARGTGPNPRPEITAF